VTTVAGGPGIGDALRDALGAAGRADAAGDGGPGPRLTAATVPVDAVDPIALYAAAVEVGHEAALLVSPDERFALVGIGRAWAVEPPGPDRFHEAEQAWRALLGGASLGDTGAAAGADGPRGAGPVLLGGLGFTGRQPDPDDRWAPFGAASLVLPTLAFAATADGAWLTASVVDRADRGAAGRLEREWDRLVVGARERTPNPGGIVARPAVAGLSVVGQAPSLEEWDRLVGLFAGAVGRGRIDKVVLARRVDLVAPIELDVPNALRRLALSAPESTVYAFRRDGRTFLGATPERLVRTDGREFRTAAVAGSVGRGTTPAEDAELAAALLASEKDREEHAVVVTAIRAALAPVAERVTVAPAATVMPLRHVQHLVTPIEGTLHERAGLLAIAGRLHPTPAVGGEPRDVALALIDEHEGFDRGWYAGPIGWLGADGDGEVWVALRCGIVERTRTTLFAGCGIVADSDPGREWEESRIKLRAVAAALGRPEDEP
jgi:isochorismate synthase